MIYQLTSGPSWQYLCFFVAAVVYIDYCIEFIHFYSAELVFCCLVFLSCCISLSSQSCSSFQIKSNLTKNKTVFFPSRFLKDQRTSLILVLALINLPTFPFQIPIMLKVNLRFCYGEKIRGRATPLPPLPSPSPNISVICILQHHAICVR